MGNAHGHHKFRNDVNEPDGFPFKYGSGPSSSQSTTQVPNSTMESFPYAHVDSSLRALATQAEGFGRFAIGGLHGSLYHVTTLAGHLHFSTFFPLHFSF